MFLSVPDKFHYLYDEKRNTRIFHFFNKISLFILVYIFIVC